MPSSNVIQFTGHSKLAPIASHRLSHEAAALRDRDDIYSEENPPADARYGKYWNLRRDLFHKFEEGILLDGESLYSVKPEESANRIAAMISGDSVLDPFCGAGGTAIAFARAGKQVFANDSHSDKLAIAANNARTYGVDAQIVFSNEDARDAINDVHADAVYFDPPWGGPDYYKLEKFLLTNFYPPTDGLLKVALEKFREVLITVPVNFDCNELYKFEVGFEILPEISNGRTIFRTVKFIR